LLGYQEKEEEENGPPAQKLTMKRQWVDTRDPPFRLSSGLFSALYYQPMVYNQYSVPPHRCVFQRFFFFFISMLIFFKKIYIDLMFQNQK
jgi:hypothetical protein